MKKNNVLNKIKSGEVKMRPKWNFVAIKWLEVIVWIASIGLVVTASTVIAYFMSIYNPQDLAEFGDLGWQIFYEDFPYLWVITAIICLMVGTIILLKTGNNYKRSWQKNLMITAGIILILTIGVLYLKN